MRHARFGRRPLARPLGPRSERPYRVVTLASSKGGVGKTTLAIHLAFCLRALREDLPVLLVGLDDQSMIDRALCLEAEPPRTGRTLAFGLRSHDLSCVLRPGQRGVRYAPSPQGVAELNRILEDPDHLERSLDAARVEGVVIVDTRSDLDALTRTAVAASHLVLVPTRDEASFLEGRKLFELLERSGRPRERARFVLSMVDRRVRYAHATVSDLPSLLRARMRAEHYPVLDALVSRSRRLESQAVLEAGGVALGRPSGSRAASELLRLTREIMQLLEIDSEPGVMAS